MIGLVLVTHGRLAEELRAAMEHVVGTQRNVATVCIGPDDDMEGRRSEIHRRIDEVDTGDGVILLTDMFGGTPSNLCISQMDRPGVEVIAGVNLPMLVKFAKVRSNQPLVDAVDCAQMAGRKYIAAASHVLPHCRAPNGVAVNGAVNGTTATPTLTAVNGGKLNGTTG
jgi:PTS system mannose-specific IIA component